MSPSFNEARYKALKDGLECSEIMFSNINNDFRIDAEYFLRSYLELDKMLKNNKTIAIGKMANVTDGIHTSIDYDNNSDINLISATSPKNNVFDLSRGAKISLSAHNKNPRTALRYGDVIISTVGTIGNCAVVDDTILPANSDRHVCIIRIKGNYLPNCLSSFILSKYGRFQTIRETTGNVQPNLFLYKIREILLPNLTNDFQKIVDDAVVYAHSLLNRGNDLYFNAKQLLLFAIGYNPERAPETEISERSLSMSFGLSGRLDAEYYQPKYDDLFSLLDKLPTKPLGEIVNMKKSIEPGRDCYSEEGVPFIRVSDISTTGIDSPPIRIPKNVVPSIETLYPQKDIILFSKDGSVGIAYKIEEDMEAVTSGALLHLRIKDSAKILPDYLTLVLNSDIVQFQAERDASGAIIQHWKPGDIAKVIIPILPRDVQRKISRKVQESFALRRQAEKFIKTAIKAVEIAIENNEETAIDYIKGNENRLCDI